MVNIADMPFEFINKNLWINRGFIGWDREIRTPEMTGSEPVALPLGYIPTADIILPSVFENAMLYFTFSQKSRQTVTDT